MPKILIIEDDAAFCQMLQKFLTRKDYDVDTSFTAPDAKSKFKATSYDLVITDLRLPNYDGIKLLSEIKEISTDTAVVVMTGYAEVGTAVLAMKEGAYDYISKPFTPDEMLMVITSALRARERKKEKAKKPKKEPNTPTISNSKDKVIVGASEASKKLEEYIKLVAPTNMSVLITGDSGTGKEVTARAIHNLSKRSAFNFVAVDCGAIPKEIAASEFFGHIKGSFTGAVNDKIGHFEAANEGTLFLDEIGNLSYENQIQLLRVLQERKVKKVGSTVEQEINVRIITATNEDLTQAVEKGTFREDLYHRLNEFFIEIPSLADRFSDLLLFADHFIELANTHLDKNVLGFSQEVLHIFQQYHWPGNLRELQNVIKRAVLLTHGDYIEKEVLPKEVLPKEIVALEANAVLTEEFSKAVFEKDQILKALQRTNFNKSKAAKLLQVTRKTLYNKINHYNLDL